MRYVKQQRYSLWLANTKKASCIFSFPLAFILRAVLNYLFASSFYFLHKGVDRDIAGQCQKHGLEPIGSLLLLLKVSLC